jgi:putative endonuclease
MSKKLGDIAEQKASIYLEQNGYIIIDTNYYTRFGEIDIICTKNNTIHFIEVKSGIGFEPAQNITKSKVNKLIKSMDIYLQKRKITKMNYTLSAVIIKDEDITLIENITLG